MDEADARPLAAVVKQTGEEQIRGIGAAIPEVAHDVEAVAPVRGVHPVEEGELVRLQLGGERRALGGGHTRAEVRPGSPQLQRPPARHRPA